MKSHAYRLKIHDRYQLELKFDYPIRKDRPHDAVQTECYFFVPQSLGLSQDTYSQSEFYQDLQTYTRYGTPTIPLARLVDKNLEHSPLTRIENLKAELTGGAPGAEALERTEYELRILTCIFRSETRDTAEMMGERLKKSQPAAKDFEEAVYLSDKFLDEAHAVTRRLRALAREILNPHFPENAERAFRYADEAMSVQLEGVCGKLYRTFARSVKAAPPEFLESGRRLLAAMREEEQYRKDAGYPTLVDTGDGKQAARSNEYFLYRVGVLKKYAQSTLFLSVERHAGSRPLWYTIYAIAAMAAMTFFVVLMWFLQDVAPINSLPYLVLAVVGYAFKDRIKEGLKRYFSERMTGILRDRETELLDRGPGKPLVGRVAEAFCFVSRGRVPADVLALRAPDELTELADEGAPETVIKYQKEVELYSNRIFRNHQRVDRLNEIIRFNVLRLLRRMDDPQKGLSIGEASDFDGLNATEMSSADEAHRAALTPIHRVKATKVYHVNLILRLRVKGDDGKWKSDMQKFRLVLSRDGIERIEANGGAVPETLFAHRRLDDVLGAARTPSGFFPPVRV